MTLIPPMNETDYSAARPAVMRNRIKELESIIKHLELIIESSYEAIIVSDHNGVIVKVNKSLERLTGGIKPEELLGKTAEDLEQEGMIISQSKKILDRNPLTIKQKIKTGVELFVTSNRVCDDSGRVLFYVATIRDMTHLQYLQKELEETKDLSNKYYHELQELRSRFLDIDEIIIKSPQMIAIMDKVLKVARTEANVLLTGESGVGKEVVAKMLHRTSVRKDGPFIQINCGAIPETLLESELFGYEKGAFTDALRRGKPGFFEIANRGNILLDEIGDLPLNLQVKLLRVIQEKELFRLGGTKPVKLDVRIIAATNRSLENMVKQGKFREDLYYRLNVVPFEIPPLRERKMDIIPMAYVFLKKYNKKHDLQKKLSPAVCKILEDYPWPGNVRELKNMIERLVIVSDHNNISLSHLSSQLVKASQALFSSSETPLPSAPEHQSTDLSPSENQATEKTARQRCNIALHQAFKELLQHDSSQILTLKEIRELAEKQAVALALNKYKSQRKTALALGVDHTTLTRKLKKWGNLPEPPQW